MISLPLPLSSTGRWVGGCIQILVSQAKSDVRPVGSISTETTFLFGQRLSMPVFISPAGVHALCDEEGECASARACGKVGTLFGLSQHATRTIEQVAEACCGGTNLWYQSYILKVSRTTFTKLWYRMI